MVCASSSVTQLLESGFLSSLRVVYLGFGFGFRFGTGFGFGVAELVLDLDLIWSSLICFIMFYLAPSSIVLSDWIAVWQYNHSIKYWYCRQMVRENTEMTIRKGEEKILAML